MEYEIVRDNEYFKTIRLSYGVLINIYKYELGEDISWHFKEKRKDIKKIDDKLYETKRIVINKYTNEEYPIGTKLYQFAPCVYLIIKEKLEKKSWSWELKTTGDYFSGKTDKFKNMIKEILKIMEEE